MEIQDLHIYERKPGALHSFFALKFHEGDEDREKVETIESALNKAGVEITLMARDVEKWGEVYIPEGNADFYLLQHLKKIEKE